MPRKLSDRELRFLRILNASPTINSGATLGDADGIIKTKPVGYYKYPGIGVEIKCTDNKSFSVTKLVLDKLKTQVGNLGYMPVLGIDLQGEKYIVMRANDFIDLLEHEQNGDK